MSVDTKFKLTRTTVVMHWLIAVIFICMVAIGLTLENMAASDQKTDLLNLHKSIGLVFFFLAIYRVVHRVKKGFPIDLSLKPVWQKRMSTIVHWTLLAATITAPITGMFLGFATGTEFRFFGVLLSPSGTENPALVGVGHVLHSLSTNIIMIIVILHSAAAFRQEFKDRTLSRMLGRSPNK